MNTEEDFQAHRKCAWCKKLQPQKTMLDYNDKYFCCIQCKLKQEEMEDDALYRHIRPSGNRSAGK